MVARVTLEIALRREFDYAIPSELAGQIDVGTRVRVPFGNREVFGVVTALVKESTQTNLRYIVRAVGVKSLITPKVLELARWIADYYCCAPETALKSVLPTAVRTKEKGFKEQLFVRMLPVSGDHPKLTKRQQEIYQILEEHRELPMTGLCKLAECTAETVRRLEDKGMVTISTEVSERDPYANEVIGRTEDLKMNGEQAVALERILQAMAGPSGILPGAPNVSPTQAANETPFFDRDAETEKHQNRLPHWEQHGKIHYVTFRLADSVSQERALQWREDKDIWLKQHPKPWSKEVARQYNQRFTLKMEELLDAGYGACELARPEIANLVAEALRYFDRQNGEREPRYELGEFVVMPNHVHVLVKPIEGYGLSSIIQSWKSFTATKINGKLGLKGAFWKDENFDHVVRSEEFLTKYEEYIRENPGKAGLAPTSFVLGEGSLRKEMDAAARAEASCSRQDAGRTDRGAHDDGPPKPFVLHGVTGSGKTEVYLQAIAKALESGKGAIVLVPEISLTPQTVERFKSRFSHGPLRTLVAVLHSHLSAGERHDEWHKIRQGRARIVIGARSAIFAPVDPLGLIIVDEEHEHSYKQEESPRYHARDVAVVRGAREKAVVVLGSATPSMESFYNVKKGKYELLELTERADDKNMPIVRVMDMRSEARKEKGPPIFSPSLKEAITQRLERKEQTILFLNRRGYSTSLQCPECGYVAECPNCSVSLTYHRRESKIACHICGLEQPAPRVCPEQKCGNPAIRYAGLGTERVEDTLGKLFPKARIQRMDSDLMKRKDDYRKALNDFKAGKTDILIGTQMIAKGLHFENVTLVGVIHADLGLHVPDFRAGERTFQLLTQVAGRAGRGDVEGEVYVQSFTPFHPAIQYARRHDFEGFYDQEIDFREQLRYPPVSRVCLLTLRGRNEEKVEFTAEHLLKELEKLQPQFKDMVLAGPAPAPLMRAETFYRYQIMARAGQMSLLSRELAKVMEKFGMPDDIRLTIDIDPVNLM